MKKNNKHNRINADPLDIYEEMLRLEKLDPYESLIQSHSPLKQKNKYIK